ncbi:VOC family protein [Rhizobium rhizogenes]|uniref:VOC family protein n=1 Tax=Rhizobium rhizogenes TaxID=359 RepID=UPI001574681E|nr:VOC family protein [Rhizobium rhizogenes]NTI78522.1 VOC family protein [Rhizobium rhizogenes]
MTASVEDPRYGGIIQYAFTTPDIRQAMENYVDQFGIGPWFVSGPFVPPEGLYRGQPTVMRLSLAIAFSGNRMIELIQQHDDKPSVYQELIAKRGHGFHHWAIGTRDLEGEVERFTSQGYEVVFSDRSPRGVRIAYVDTSADFPGMTEIIEISDDLLANYDAMLEATQTWDGRDPIRMASIITTNHGQAS